jgi:hypothetical protein
MRRSGFIAMCLISWPATAAEPGAEPPDAEFLEFLAELPDEDTGFMAYLEPRSGERELKQAERTAAKEDDDE